MVSYASFLDKSVSGDSTASQLVLLILPLNTANGDCTFILQFVWGMSNFYVYAKTSNYCKSYHTQEWNSATQYNRYERY